MAKERALSEATEPSEPMPYSNSDEFVAWCKELPNGFDLKVASALAADRMTGRLWTWVHSMAEIRPGDHVAYKSAGLKYYYQHAIVMGIIEGRLHYSANTQSPSALCT